MDQNMFIFAFISLFTIVNPFSTASVFMTITPDYTKKEKRYTAMRAMVISFIILIIFAFLGKGILNFFNISIEGLRLAGGILLAGMGLKMINQKRKRIHSEEEHEEILDREDISIIPLSIPFISGPGTITTIMLLVHDATSIIDTMAIVVAAMIVCGITGITMLESKYFEKALGVTGNKVLGKIMGLIVLVIGIQFIINGVHNLLTQWGLIII